MALTFVGRTNFPAYIALSEDIDDDTIPGVQPGLTVYILDTGDWYIVQPDFSLVDFHFPTPTPA